MKRREFLLAGLGALAGSTVASRGTFSQARSGSAKVIVIGAGLTGLVVAHELRKTTYPS